MLEMQKVKHRMQDAMAACAVVLLATAAPAFAHEGHTHKYMGTIASVHEGQLTVKTTDGKQVTFVVADKTQILRGTVKANASDLTEGTRVVVEAEGGKEPMAAKRIRLGTK